MTGLKKLEVVKTATKLQTQSITRNTLGETVGRMFGMMIEIFQEAGDIETLADIKESIPIITTAHIWGTRPRATISKVQGAPAHLAYRDMFSEDS